MPPSNRVATNRSDSTLHPLLELARGGMGHVSLVCLFGTAGFRRLYAMKRLRPEIADDERMRAMFLHEARVAGLLRHPHAVSVLDAGEDDDGPFLLMEYVEGVSLSDLLREVGRLDLGECLYIGAALADALHAAHELKHHDGTALGLIHRDVSPSNVMIDVDGQAWLTDFGIARTAISDQRTQTGVLKGKFGYMAPEQLRFEPIDRRADLFSLGVVLYEMLAGARLYKEPDPRETAYRILHEEVPDISEVRRDAPPELVRLSFLLLAKDPADRPSTAREIAQELRAIAQAQSIDLTEQPTLLASRVDGLFGESIARMREEVAKRIEEVREGAHDEARPRAPWIVAAVLGALALSAGGYALVAYEPDASGERPAPSTSVDAAAAEVAIPTAEIVAPPPAASTIPDAGPLTGSDAGPAARRRRRGRGRSDAPPDGRWTPLTP
ncbi:MAG: serine/threonine protein kinase [Sandaracinaceae bacterium]